MTFRGFVKWGRRFRRADRTDCGSMSSERSSRIRGKAGNDAGAAMVEMAMVFSLLIMLLVGTVTAAIAFGE